MKNFIKILGLILLVGGSVLAMFTAIPVADYIGIAVSALGLALLIVSTLKKAEKKTWKEYVAVVLFALAGLCCGFAGFAENTVIQIATAVSGLVALIIGLITTFSPKEVKKE